MRRRLLAALLVLGLGLWPFAAVAADRPWEEATALADAVSADLRADGLGAMRGHVRAVERALSQAEGLFDEPIADGERTIVLTDGEAETLAVLAGRRGDTVAVANPYPRLGFYLGSYYVETEKYRDALRALEAGLALSPLPEEMLGETVPQLLSEHGIVLGRLGRWEEALRSYDRALGLPRLPPPIVPLLHRGRGFALIELGRLDDAEAAYRESLRLDPDNEIALNELGYIEGLRGGMAPTEPLVTIPGAN